MHFQTSLALALVAAGCATSRPPRQEPAPASVARAADEPSLAAVRSANERFRDVRVALAEGYVRDPANHCTTAAMVGYPPEDGAMGVHYFRPDRLGIAGPPDPLVRGTGTYTDFLEPAVLIYEPQADGSLELVAVENLVFADAWHAAGHTEPPAFHGVPYDHMADDPATEVDEGHGFAPHYDRHVWVYRENPNGVFAQFNPDVTCAHHDGAHAAARRD